MSIQRSLILGVLGLATSACYGTELDSSIDGVFTCDVNSDCALGSACVSGVCRDEALLEGPTLRVLDPPQLTVFPMGDTAPISMLFEGENILLTASDAEAANAGYIEVLLDGAVVDTVTDGVLEDGIVIDSVLPPQAPGLHHIGLQARRLDGEPFDGEESTASMAFWIDDGAEHVGILSPAPGAKVSLADEELRVEVASLNFTLVNPGYIDPTQGGGPAEGYVHLYIDAEVPNCLPACNFEHQSIIVPAGLSRVNRIIAEQGVILPGELGTTRVQIVAQDLNQQPYYRDEASTDLVFHQVPVQSIVTVTQ